MEWETIYYDDLYESDGQETFDFDYYDACREQQVELQAEIDEATLWDI
jgi:hypothetical protein